MKTLVVFYSLEGNTKLVANIIAEELGAEILELKPKKEIPKGKFSKYVWGGKSVIFGEKPELLNKIPNMEAYDKVFIGTPIWAGTFTPPVNTFISSNIITSKKVAFFACNAGGGAKKCFDKLKTLFINNSVIGSIDFVQPAKQNKEKVKEEIKAWLKKIS